MSSATPPSAGPHSAETIPQTGAVKYGGNLCSAQEARGHWSHAQSGQHLRLLLIIMTSALLASIFKPTSAKLVLPESSATPCLACEEGKSAIAGSSNCIASSDGGGGEEEEEGGEVDDGSFNEAEEIDRGGAYWKFINATNPLIIAAVSSTAGLVLALYVCYLNYCGRRREPRLLDDVAVHGVELGGREV